MDQIKGIVFDLYGTLIYLENETKPYVNLLNELKKYKSIKELKNIFLTSNFPSLSKLIQEIVPNIQLDVSFYEKALLKELKSVKIYPETLKVIAKLKNYKIKTAIISNLATPYKKPFYDFGLDKKIDRYLFSCEVGMKKPDEKIYKLIIDEFNLLPKEILMVGNSLYCDFYGPKSVKMKALLLDRKNKYNFSNKINSLSDIFQTKYFY